MRTLHDPENSDGKIIVLSICPQKEIIFILNKRSSTVNNKIYSNKEWFP